MNTSNYFSEVTDPRVTGRCLPLLSDILMIGLCTYLTGGTDYEDMRLFALERGEMLNDLLSLPNGVPSEDTFERVFQRIEPSELVHYRAGYFDKTGHVSSFDIVDVTIGLGTVFHTLRMDRLHDLL